MSKFQDAINDMNKKIKDTSEKIGAFLESESKVRAPVKTGNLRRNINHQVENEDNKSTIFIGGNVEYGATIEMGSLSRNIKAQPHIRPSIEENIGQIKNMIKEGLAND